MASSRYEREYGGSGGNDERVATERVNVGSFCLRGLLLYWAYGPYLQHVTYAVPLYMYTYIMFVRKIMGIP